jgi:hypothetical protein
MVGTKDFSALFTRLRELMAPYGDQLVVARDLPGDYYVETRWVRDDGYRGYFGAVQTKSRYVSYHLMPVYAWPDLLDGASPELRRRMQGKSCFNFSTSDDALLAELGELTGRAFERMRTSGADVHPRHRWSHSDDLPSS